MTPPHCPYWSSGATSLLANDHRWAPSPKLKATGLLSDNSYPFGLRIRATKIAFPHIHIHGMVPNCYTKKLLGQKILSSPKCPHLHWGPSNNVFNCYCISFSGVKWQEPVKDYPFSFRFEVNHSWSYSSTPQIRLNGKVSNQHMNKFTWARGYFLLANMQTCCGANLTSHSKRIVFLSLD